MSTPDDAQAATLAANLADEEHEQAGPRLGGSRRWWLVGGVLVAVAVAFLTWSGLAASRDAVSFHDVGYSVDSPRQVTARWQVTKPADRAVTCLVRALDKRYGVVGAVDVTVPAGRATAEMTTVIRTTSEAVNGTVRACELVPQG